MKIYNAHALDTYLKDDYILALLEQTPEDKAFVSHKWLLDMPVKRMIYADVYGPLLKEQGKKVLDVGGGFCGVSRKLVDQHDYTLLDLMTHDNHKKLESISKAKDNFWEASDWAEYKPSGSYDYIIANDLFPNVDQRLKTFINTYQKHAQTLIITLTCNDRDLSYKVKRIDGGEVLTMVPWSRHITEEALRQMFPGENITLPELNNEEPLFGNGRVVYKFTHSSH